RRSLQEARCPCQFSLQPDTLDAHLHVLHL
ncbi:hypothetical protein VCHENC02_0360, partial [Vibrio harveyi]